MKVEFKDTVFNYPLQTGNMYQVVMRGYNLGIEIGYKLTLITGFDGDYAVVYFGGKGVPSYSSIEWLIGNYELVKIGTLVVK